MNGIVSYGFICSLLLGALAGLHIADEQPSYIAYIQGGESIIIEGSDGMMEITVTDVIPFINVVTMSEKHLYLVKELTNQSYPKNAAPVFFRD